MAKSKKLMQMSFREQPTPHMVKERAEVQLMETGATVPESTTFWHFTVAIVVESTAFGDFSVSIVVGGTTFGDFSVAIVEESTMFWHF